MTFSWNVLSFKWVGTFRLLLNILSFHNVDPLKSDIRASTLKKLSAFTSKHQELHEAEPQSSKSSQAAVQVKSKKIAPLPSPDEGWTAASGHGSLTCAEKRSPLAWNLSWNASSSNQSGPGYVREGNFKRHPDLGFKLPGHGHSAASNAPVKSILESKLAAWKPAKRTSYSSSGGSIEGPRRSFTHNQTSMNKSGLAEDNGLRTALPDSPLLVNCRDDYGRYLRSIFD